MKIAIVEKLEVMDQLKIWVERDYEVFIQRIPNLAVEYFMGNLDKLQPKSFIERHFIKNNNPENIAKIIREAVKYALNIYEKEIKKETIKIPE